MALNNPIAKDTLSYDPSLQKWKNHNLGAVVLSTSGTTRPNNAGACLFTGADPGVSALPGDMWLSAEAVSSGSGLTEAEWQEGIFSAKYVKVWQLA